MKRPRAFFTTSEGNFVPTITKTELSKLRKKAQKGSLPSVWKKGGMSSLESEFAFKWKALGGQELIREYIFHPTRKWRIDFYRSQSSVAIEIEGGIWKNMGHNRGKGYLEDIEKYNAMTCCGIKLFRLGTGMINTENIKMIIDFIKCHEEEKK